MRGRWAMDSFHLQELLMWTERPQIQQAYVSIQETIGFLATARGKSA
jgi:hypothetical protein